MAQYSLGVVKCTAQALLTKERNGDADYAAVLEAARSRVGSFSFLFVWLVLFTLVQRNDSWTLRLRRRWLWGEILSACTQ